MLKQLNFPCKWDFVVNLEKEMVLVSGTCGEGLEI